MRKIIEQFVKYGILSNTVIAVTIIAGVVALLNTKKTFFPERELKAITIQITYPGASPEEVEEGITQKIEEEIRNIPGVEEINSTSSENFASINIKILESEDLDDAYTEIKNAVDRISSFPVGVERPIIFKNRSRSTVSWVALYSEDNSTDLLRLKSVADRIRDDFLRSGKVSQVILSGFPPLEIAIEVAEERLLEYGLTFDQVSQAVSMANRDISGGSIKTKNEEILIRSRGKRTEVDKIKDIVLRANNDGSLILLRNVADVKLQFEDRPVKDILNGKQIVSIRVDKLITEDIDEVAGYVEEYVEKFNSETEGLKLEITFSFIDMLKQRISMLLENGLMGLILVLISLSLFLNTRLSLWVAWGIPSSFLGLFIIGSFVGFTINMISLFGMILVIGILVDDGIVIAENIYSHFEKGKNPYRAAVDGTLEVLPAVTTSVLTTMVAFTPILLLQSGFSFLRDMAIVVIASLGFSLLEAFFVLPAHLASPHILRSKKKTNFATKIRGKINQAINFLRYKIYGSVLRITMKYKWVSMAFLIALFPITIGLFGGGFIKATFFPNIPFSQINLNLTLKAGTREQVVEKMLVDFESKIWEVNKELKKKYAEEKDFVEYSIISLGNNSDGESGSHAGTIQIFYRDMDDMPISGRDLGQAISKKIGNVSEAEKFSVGNVSRFGKPVAVKLIGKNFKELNSASEFLKAELAKIDALKEIKDDQSVGNRELRLALKSKAHFLGLTHNEISRQVRQGFFGDEVQRLQKGKDEVKVWVRFPNSGRLNLGQLEKMKIKYAGAEYPLNELVDYNIKRGISDVKHFQTARTVTVDAELVDPFAEVPPITNKVFGEIVPQLKAKFPGVIIDTGGQVRESNKSRQEMLLYFAGAFFIMFLIIMINFKSFYQAVLIVSMIPLGWLGATWGHGLHGHPVSILSAWGMVALSGVIINDAVVFLDKFNRNMKEGMSVYDAAYDAGLARFRPILLTSITTVLGLYPLILETSFQAQFLVPMAISVAWGVLIGTMIILLFFPVLILYFNQVRVWMKWAWTGSKPKNENVERVIIDKGKDRLLHPNEEIVLEKD